MIRWFAILLGATSLGLLAPVGAGAQRPDDINRSGDGTYPVELSVDNKTGQKVGVFWVDQNGEEHGYGTIEPGATFRQDSSNTHVWRFKVGDRTIFTQRLFDEPGLPGTRGAQNVRLGPELLNNQQPRRDPGPNARAGAQGNGAAERSGNGNRPVQIAFRNGAGLPVSVFWVDSDGVERGYGRIQPGERIEQQSTSTHLWRFKVGSRTVANYRASDDRAQEYVIRNPPLGQRPFQGGADQPRPAPTPDGPGNPRPAPIQGGADRPNPPAANAQAGPQSLPQDARAAFAYLNRVRANPPAFSARTPREDGADEHARINVDIGKVRPPRALAWNDTLAQVAEAKALELASESIRRKELFFEHTSPNGEGINVRMLRAGYQMPADWAEPLDRGNFENIGSKWDRSPDPSNLGPEIINQLINDGGLPDDKAGHRTAVLGMDTWNANMVDVGVGLVRFPDPRSSGGYAFVMILVLGKHAS